MADTREWWLVRNGAGALVAVDTKPRMLPMEHHVVEHDALADRDRRIEALTKALQSAIHALRSYQCGNSSSELAQSVADACSKALASAAGAPVTEDLTRS